MKRSLFIAALACVSLCGTSGAFAQQNQNPMGLDYGPFHPAVPSQVTTYYPPSEPATAHRRHHARRPMY